MESNQPYPARQKGHGRCYPWLFLWLLAAVAVRPAPAQEVDPMALVRAAEEAIKAKPATPCWR